MPMLLIMRHDNAMKTSALTRPFGRNFQMVLAAALFVVAVDVLAQSNVVKCIDPSGNTTYQDAPCEAGQAGRSVDLPKAEDRTAAEPWEAAAREGHVIRGMPKRWVLRARGAPQEIRPGSIRDEATEIWRYAERGGAFLVGFAGPDVAWTREDAMAATPAGKGKDAAGMGAGAGAADPGARGPHNRRFVIVGRYCQHVFAEIGAADRQEPAASPPGALRYVYEPREGDLQMRTAFTCAGGKVVDVERTVVR